MSPQTGATRRDSLKTMGTFLILPSGLAKGYSANAKLNIGIIGITGIGRSNAKALSALGENICAICDVDTNTLEKRGAEYPKAKRYTDFRKMIAKEKLDGVVVATPDHSHAYISIWAMKHGLHVYCQKPLTQTVHEARVVARVAAETKVVTQMGTQTSAEAAVLRNVEMVQSGVLGEMTEVHMTTDRPIWPQGHDRPSGEDPVPRHLNWDMWIGPARMRPFIDKWPEGHAVYSPARKNQFRSGPRVYHPGTWRGWTEFGSGALGDIAAHTMNEVFLALDLGAPQVVEVVETSGMKKEMYPDFCHIRFDFMRGGTHPLFSIHWYDGDLPLPEHLQPPAPPPEPGAPPLRRGAGGMVWVGTKGTLPGRRGRFANVNVDYPVPPQKDWGREEVHKDWVTAIRNGSNAPCNFGYAGPFTEAYQLGNVALRVGHRVQWDPLAFRVTNCREANQYISREYRRGWDLKEIAGSAWVSPPI
ncbi:MAG: Gfo/Idh/MocA family oxidoreductase [Bryobacterales bacterium]|nr:Gfo/Idh/MocA family oxidoreductase [Bryobacterales bacterium]